MRDVGSHVPVGAGPYRDGAVDVDERTPAVELRFERPLGGHDWRLGAREHSPGAVPRVSTERRSALAGNSAVDEHWAAYSTSAPRSLPVNARTVPRTTNRPIGLNAGMWPIRRGACAHTCVASDDHVFASGSDSVRPFCVAAVRRRSGELTERHNV